MDKCMKQVKKEFPKGRSKKKMSKKEAHKQHVAMCLNAQEGVSMKKMLEGISFSDFLVTEVTGETDENDVRGFIRSLPQYQELKQDDRTKSDAIKLARSFVDEFGGQRLSPEEKDYILDTFDDMSRETFKGRVNVGDWRGEEEYRRKRAEDRDIEGAVDKWEKTTGMDAETGEEKKPRKRRKSGARVGMSYTGDKKAAKAKADFEDDKADRIGAAKAAAATAKAPKRGAMTSAAKQIFNAHYGIAKPSEVIKLMMSELGMSKPYATSYYYRLKKQVRQQAASS